MWHFQVENESLCETLNFGLFQAGEFLTCKKEISVQYLFQYFKKKKLSHNDPLST